MITASYVGRVGALAVALGVGTAIFAGQGVARADESTSSSSKPSVSATSSGDSADTRAATAKPDDATSTDDTAADAPSEADDAEADDPEADDPEADDPEAEPDETDAPDADLEPAAEPDRRTSAKPTGESLRAAEPESDAQTDSTAADTAESTREESPAPQTAATVTTGTTTTGTTTIKDTTATSAKTTLADLSTTEQDRQSTVAKPTLITAVVNVVNSMIDWARQKAAADPADAPQPPFLWALMAFARRELETLFAARTSNSPRNSTAASTSLALGDAPTAAAAAAAVTPQPFRSPWLNPQVSASTKFISWVTGAFYDGDYALLANTLKRFNVYGTDVGVMWDNGMVDDPSTPDIDERQILIAVGDTFGGPGMTGRHIYNTLFRSSDRDLSDGMTIPDGEWYNGNMFGGAPLDKPDQARPIINRPSWLPGSVTLIPTAGVSLPTEVTEDTPFGTIQYVSFMSVTRWGQAGRWSTNYSGIAYSTDNGENFTVAPSSVRYNSFFSGNRNFQQSAFVKGDDGYVYMYGTPNGRQGAAYLARVAPKDILNASKYEYYKKASSGWFGSSPARWVAGSPSSASSIIGKSGGLFGFTKPGYTVSEMSVQYNEYLKKYIVLYGDQSNNIVMRTSDSPEGGWSDATVLMRQQTGGIYAPMLHPWSPSTEGTGSTLYWNLSLWSEYNIMLMETDLSKI